MRLLFSLLLGFSLFGGPKQIDTIKVLAIGNSFSEDAVEHYLHKIATAKGKTIVIGNMYIGGCSLERHFNNSVSGSTDYEYRKIEADGTFTRTPGFTLEQALADEQWDVVTLQQCSPESGRFESYEPYIKELIKYVKARTGRKVRLMFHQTWAYAKDSSHPDFGNYDKDQNVMYEAIMKASRKAVGKYNLKVIPSGTAIQNARSFLGNDNQTRDGFHLNGFGQYTASCVWYEVLFKSTVFGSRYAPDGFSADDIRAAQWSADAAVKHPYKTCLK